MLFTAANDYKRIQSVEMIIASRHRWVTDEATQASMPGEPGLWGIGWADCLKLNKGTGRPVWRMQTDDNGQPIIHRRYGLIRWHA